MRKQVKFFCKMLRFRGNQVWKFIELSLYVRGFRESFARNYTITLRSKRTGKSIYERNNCAMFNEIAFHSARSIGLAISSWSSSFSRDFTFTPCIVDSRLEIGLHYSFEAVYDEAQFTNFIKLKFEELAWDSKESFYETSMQKILWNLKTSFTSVHKFRRIKRFWVNAYRLCSEIATGDQRMIHMRKINRKERIVFSSFNSEMF